MGTLLSALSQAATALYLKERNWPVQESVEGIREVIAFLVHGIEYNASEAAKFPIEGQRDNARRILYVEALEADIPVLEADEAAYRHRRAEEARRSEMAWKGVG